MSFESLAKLASKSVNSILGQEIIYISEDETTTKTINAVVSDNTIEIDPMTGEAILTNKVSIDICLGEVAPEDGDSFQIKSELYKIVDQRKDSYGNVKILLEKAIYAE